MSTAIRTAKLWLDRHPKSKQWAWFAALWLGGLLAALAISMPVKLLVLVMKN